MQEGHSHKWMNQTSPSNHFSFQDKDPQKQTICVHLSSASKDSAWTPEGCWHLHSNNSHSKCSCQYLSTYAVLMATIPKQVCGIWVWKYLPSTNVHRMKDKRDLLVWVWEQVFCFPGGSGSLLHQLHWTDHFNHLPLLVHSYIYLLPLRPKQQHIHPPTAGPVPLLCRHSLLSRNRQNIQQGT